MGLPKSVLIIPLPLVKSKADNVPATSYGFDASGFLRLEPAPAAIAGIHPETRIRHMRILSMLLSCSILGLWEINVPSDGVIGVGILTSSCGLRWNWLRWRRICWSWASRF